MWAEFDRLRQAWSTRREATGGLAALAGFNFQLAAALLELAKPKAQQSPSDIFVETLSDFATKNRDFVVVTQCKLTLDSSAFRKALEELWEIDLLASTVTPKLQPQLRYFILTSEQILQKVAAALARWQPEGTFQPVALQAFRERVSVRVEADPRQALATHLVNAFGEPDPFTKVDRWLGQLLSNPTIGGLKATCSSITTELVAMDAAARERAIRFHIWEAAERAPREIQLEANPDKATLTGQIPQRKHLVEGRFARRWFYEALGHETEAFLAKAYENADSRFSVLWIAGRSGAGKSVALLHLIADLHQADDRRVIIWLDQQADRLNEALRWARPFFADNREIILAADDPYTPDRYQRVSASIESAMREFDAVFAAHPNAKRPVLMFAGPTEQSHFFQDDHSDQVILQSFSLPTETQQDYNELRDWYLKRTGHTTLPVGETKNILIVQLFFEWVTGQPIREFAQRLRSRLEGMARATSARTIFDIVSEILAFNRLYALFPSHSVVLELEQNPEIGSAFDLLNEEEKHLTFDAEKGGYRLTHPHLANAIYTTWFGRDQDRRHRKLHLRAGIEAGLAFKGSISRKFATLWAIARVASNGTRDEPDAIERLALIKTELRELLLEIYANQFVKTDQPLVDLPVWSDLDRYLELKLQPRPIDLIAATVPTAEQNALGLRLSCHKLLQHHNLHVDAAFIVAQALIKHRGWFEWQSVAIDFVNTIGVAPIEAPLLELVSSQWTKPATRDLIRACVRKTDEPAARLVVLKWLQSCPNSDPAWPFILNIFLGEFKFCEVSRSLAWEYLRQQVGDQRWTYVWSRLFASATNDREDVLAAARSWIEKAAPDTPGWDFVWNDLWGAFDATDDGLRVRGRNWLDEVGPSHARWAFIWQELWVASGRASEDLRNLGLDWLEESPTGNGSWAFLWAELLKAPDSAVPELLSRGRRWLAETSATHGSWGFVWQELWDRANRKDEDLRQRARKWLDDAPREHKSWNFVWEELWRSSQYTDEDLRTRGFKWLNDASPEDGAWAFIWEALQNASGGANENLRVLGRKWLDDTPPAHGSWGFVWEKLREAFGETTDLIARGRRWLDETPPEHGSWYNVWGKLLNASSADNTALLALGRSWLDQVPQEHGAWGLVWEKLWSLAGNSNEDLCERGVKWLREAPAQHQAWGFICQELWRASGNRDDRLRDLARKWLDEMPFEFLGWPYVWEGLWRGADKSDADLGALGRAWLDKVPPEHKSWNFVWRELWIASNKSDVTLLGLGRKWLEEASLAHGAWAYIWAELWQASGGSDANLRSLACSWLDQVPCEHGSWAYVWQPLWKASNRKDDKLQASARSWLDKVPEHKSWGHVWRDLWRFGRKDIRITNDLLSLAQRWLQIKNLRNPAWAIVWTILWDETNSDRLVLQQFSSSLLTSARPKDTGPVERRLRSEHGVE